MLGSFLYLSEGREHATQQAKLSAHKGHFIACRMEPSCFWVLLFPCCIFTLRHCDSGGVGHFWHFQEYDHAWFPFQKTSHRVYISLNNDNYEVSLWCFRLSCYLLTKTKAGCLFLCWRERLFPLYLHCIKIPLQSKDASPPDIPNNIANKNRKLDFQNNPWQYVKLREKWDSRSAYTCFTRLK